MAAVGIWLGTLGYVLLYYGVGLWNGDTSSGWLGPADTPTPATPAKKPAAPTGAGGGAGKARPRP